MNCPYCNSPCQRYDIPSETWRCINHQNKPIFLDWNKYKIGYSPSTYMEVSYFVKNIGWIIFNPNKNELHIDMENLYIVTRKLVTADNLQEIIFRIANLKVFL